MQTLTFSTVTITKHFLLKTLWNIEEKDKVKDHRIAKIQMTHIVLSDNWTVNCRQFSAESQSV